MWGFELYWTLIYFSFYTYWCASNSAFTPVIGITSSAQGLKIYVITAELKKYEEIIKKNEKKHNKIVLLAKSKSAWISKSQVDICELLVASWYQKLELVINEWVCPLFWVLYYTLTSWKLEFALFFVKTTIWVMIFMSCSWVERAISSDFTSCSKCQVLQISHCGIFWELKFHTIFSLLPQFQFILDVKILCEIEKS